MLVLICNCSYTECPCAVCCYAIEVMLSFIMLVLICICSYTDCHYAEWCYASVVMLTVIMLNVAIQVRLC